MAELGYSEEYQTYLDSLTKETLLKILENAYTEVFVTDADDRYVYTNPACMRHYGLTPEQMKNMNLQSELRPERWKISLSGRVKKSKKVIIAENKYYAMEQNVVTISVPILDEDGNVEMIVSTTQDPINSYDFSIKNEVKTIVSEEEDSGEIIGSSKAIKRCLSILQKVSKTDINVLILGESGTGKSFLSKYVHTNSLRRDKPFISINCSAIPETLLESELFGYVPHAFTGASNKGKEGLIKIANGGTLFLDEIGEMAFELQAKLLRILETGEYIKIGDTKPTRVDVRIIAATNRNLPEEIVAGRFREDLFYRLSVFEIHLPPLRERSGDIKILAEAFVRKFSEKLSYSVTKMSPEFLVALSQQCWKGNIRELRNVIERSLIVCDGECLDVCDLPLEIQNSHYERSDEAAAPGSFELAAMERRHIARVLEYTKGNKTETARLLKIGLTTLYRKIEEYKL